MTDLYLCHWCGTKLEVILKSMKEKDPLSHSLFLRTDTDNNLYRTRKDKDGNAEFEISYTLYSDTSKSPALSQEVLLNELLKLGSFHYYDNKTIHDSFRFGLRKETIQKHLGGVASELEEVRAIVSVAMQKSLQKDLMQRLTTISYATDVEVPHFWFKWRRNRFWNKIYENTVEAIRSIKEDPLTVTDIRNGFTTTKYNSENNQEFKDRVKIVWSKEIERGLKSMADLIQNTRRKDVDDMVSKRNAITKLIETIQKLKPRDVTQTEQVGRRRLVTMEALLDTQHSRCSKTNKRKSVRRRLFEAEESFGDKRTPKRRRLPTRLSYD